MYLGPYKGRPLKLRSITNGILTNPNCQYHSNFIAFETLGKWYEDSLEDSSNEEILFDPDKSLEEACMKWFMTLSEPRASSKRKGSKHSDINSLMEDEYAVIDHISKAPGDHFDADETSGEKGKKVIEGALKSLDYRDVLIVCHFFYLPYECGEIASELKSNFKWLKRNAIDFTKRPPIEMENIWRSRSSAFIKRCSELCTLFERFCQLPNKQAVCDLEVFLKECQDVINSLRKYVEFLGSKERERDGGMVPRDPEAWFFRGGFIGDLERLVPTSEEDATVNKTSNSTNVVRPYFPEDHGKIYKLCNDVDHIPTSFDHDDLAFDCTVGPWLNFESTCTPYVLEVNSELVGFVCGHNDAKAYYMHYKNQWLPKMQEKYKVLLSNDQLNGEKRNKQLHWTSFIPEDTFLSKYPTVLMIYISPKYSSIDAVPIAFRCLMMSLREMKVHLLQRNLKRNQKELLVDLGFTVHSKVDSHVLFIYNNDR